MARGIKHCYWKTNNGPLQRVIQGGEYLLHVDDTNEFIVDESCIEDSNKNKKASVNGARWAFIYNGFFADVQKSNDNSLWGNLSSGGSPVKKWGLGVKYKTGSSIKFAPSGNNFYFGFKQRVELFSFEPGSGFYFYVIPVTKPSIIFAYFTESERVRRYGEFISYQLAFHGYNMEKGKSYTAKMYIFEKGKGAGLSSTKEFEENNLWDKVKVFDISGRYSEDDYNYRFNGSFPIDIAWKKGENKQKEFTLAVEVYRKDKDGQKLVTTKNFASEPTMDLVQYDKSVLKLKDLDSKASESSRFMVSEELMDSYLNRVEVQKVNQIQYIGDIRYTRKEFDPCGYSKIIIKDDGDKERTPFTAFDEDTLATNGDKTGDAYGIVAGEKKKDVSITVEKLENKNVLCNGLLLPSGQKHNTPSNIFLLDRVIAAERTSTGYTTVNDPSQKNDTDVIPDKNKAPSKDVTEVQLLESEFKGENQVVLKLNYFYNKVWMERNLGNNAASQFMWMFNYFWLSDDLAQTYYLPVSTCRYPNQIAKVKVYPDMEWEFSLKLSSDVPEVYSHTNMPTGVTSKQNRVKTLAATNNRRFLNADVSFDLAIKAKTGDFSREIAAGYAAKIEPFLKALVKVKETLDEITGVTKAKNGMAAKLASKLPFKMLPITFQMDYPVISIVGSWKLEPDKKNVNLVRRTGSVSLGFTPLIKATGKLDLIACAEFIPVAGQVIKAVRTAADVVGVEIWFNLYAFGQIDLKANITLGQEHGVEPLEASTTVGIGAELGVKATADVPKISFSAETTDDFAVELEASAKGETSLIFSGKRGISNEGMYIEAGIGFGGLLVFVTAKAKIWRAKVGVDNEAYELVEPKPDMLKGRYYYIKNK